MRRRAFSLHLALYSHALSGMFGEQHCNKRLMELGFERVPEVGAVLRPQEKILTLPI